MGGMTSLLLLLWVGVTGSTAVDLQKRVIRGRPCVRPSHVIITTFDRKFVCGGSLIKDRWVLTAAHCWRFGMNVIFGWNSSQRQDMTITAPPVMYGDKNNMVHDIMLLRLPEPVTSHIHPIDLPNCNNNPLRVVEIAGHAATAGGPNDERKPGSSPTLHCADIDVVSCDDLRNTLQKDFPEFYQVMVYQHWLCGQTPGLDICFGDSGGGVVHDGKIYGVISFLGDPNYVCRKAFAFMDLCDAEYAAWIRNTIV